MSMFRGPSKNASYEFVLASSAVSSLAWLIFEMGGKWPYNSCSIEGCLQDLLKNTTVYSHFFIDELKIESTLNVKSQKFIFAYKIFYL